MARESAVTKMWRERAEAAESESIMWSQVAHAQLLGETPYAVEYADDADYGTTEYQLWRPTGAVGGIVVSIWRSRAGDASIRIGYFEHMRDWARQLSHTDSQLGFRIAMERLTIERNRAFEQAA